MTPAELAQADVAGVARPRNARVRVAAGRVSVENAGDGDTNRRLRLALVVTRFIAGAGGVALRGALALDPERWSVTVLTADGGPLIERAEAAGMEVIRLRHMVPELSPRHDRAGIGEVAGHLAAGGYDVVHTHSAKAGAIGRMAAARAGVPVVVHTFHGFPFHEFQSRARRAAYIAIERRLGRGTDRFIAVGSGVAAEAVRLRIAPPERVRTIPVSVEHTARPLTPERRAHARRLLGLAPGAHVIGTVGRLDEQKAPLDMVAAVAAIRDPNVTAVWIGDGPMRRRTEAAIRARGLSARFLLAGERGDVADLLPALDVFAMSSLYEGLPCAVVEAMLTGVPVVATAVNSVHEVVQPGVTGLLARPADPASLAGALEHVLAHRDEAQRLAAAALAHVSDRFDPARLGPLLEGTYVSALREKGVVGASATRRPAVMGGAA